MSSIGLQETGWEPEINHFDLLKWFIARLLVPDQNVVQLEVIVKLAERVEVLECVDQGYPDLAYSF